MKIRIIIITLITCSCLSTISQEISDIVFAVARVNMIKDTNHIGTATGFFYRSNGEKFFITNKHVVYNQEADASPDKLKLVLHASRKELHQNSNSISINLFDKTGNPTWHECHDKNYDVVAIPISENTISMPDLRKFNSSIVNFFTSSNLLDNVRIQSFGDAVVIGYPLGFSDEFHNLPVYRNAMIASEYGIPFNNNEYFLIDANLHPGTSGSPVISSPGNLLIRGESSFHSDAIILLGVMSAGYDNLGLNTVWYSNVIEEIINTHYK